MMDENPWHVDSIEAFACLKCPECTFISKEQKKFQDHAVDNHPLCFILFGKKPEEEFNDINMDHIDLSDLENSDMENSEDHPKSYFQDKMGYGKHPDLDLFSPSKLIKEEPMEMNQNNETNFDEQNQVIKVIKLRSFDSQTDQSQNMRNDESYLDKDPLNISKTIIPKIKKSNSGFVIVKGKGRILFLVLFHFVMKDLLIRNLEKFICNLNTLKKIHTNVNIAISALLQKEV